MFQRITDIFSKRTNKTDEAGLRKEREAAHTKLQLERLTSQHNVMQQRIQLLQSDIFNAISRVTDIELAKPLPKAAVPVNKLCVSDFLREKGVSGEAAPSFSIGRRASYIEKRAGRGLVYEVSPTKTKRTVYPRATLNKAWRDHNKTAGG